LVIKGESDMQPLRVLTDAEFLKEIPKEVEEQGF